ncbi:MAG TPA: GMC oxidoreductase [Methylomirabilota bacterium]|jgi:choline dehydrogenase-like flavoprotein
MDPKTPRSADCEYVVVGSGAGGGTLAARLAEAGRTVVLLEAGGDPRRLVGGDPTDPDGNRLPDTYDVPAFHAFASENDALAWNFFVRHYESDGRQRQDPKYVEVWDGRKVDGVLYPRAATLGGCTAHNALIFIYPHDADWDGIASLTGDRSWSAGNMRRYLQRLESCRHRPVYRWLARLGIDPTRHGWAGWLQTERADVRPVLHDWALAKVMKKSARQAIRDVAPPITRLWWLLQGKADPNDWRLVRDNAVGVGYLPLTTRDHARTGARERVLDVARRHPDRLRIELDALATRVLLDGENRAVGVEYLSGQRLYRAHRRPRDGGERRQVRASMEVILAGGAFNTPQLLMLSGIGPREVLERHGIEVRVGLPGVGRNLQDRYEIGVVSRMTFEHWKALEGARFVRDDPPHREWASRRRGVYASNGAILGVSARSAPARPLPDLYCFGLLARFEGYYPGYSKVIADRFDYLTWAILKAHTGNRAGEVTLRSADPREPPHVNFRYFEEGSDRAGEDLDSVVAGIKLVRRINARLRRHGLVAEEECPGEHVRSDAELRDFVRAHAWGHHASCTCPMGPRELGGVVTSDLRVHGTRGLRVVDASVFPRIPGFFPVSAVYMVAEKAADDILAEARR